jgi:hypothetical protein
MDERVQQRQVGTAAEGEVDVGLARHRGGPRVDRDQLRAVGTVEPVEHAHPQHGLALRDVVP